MISPGFLLQAAAEYGGAAGGQGSGGFRSGSRDLFDQGWEVVAENPAIMVIAVVSMLVLIGLLRTRRYRI